MSGFVEKLFDSFTGDKHHNQQQQQQQSSYGGQPQQNYGGGGQPQVPYPWVARWDDREQRYIYINEQTGERSWTPPGQGQNQGYGGEQRGEYGQQNQYSNSGYGQQQQGQYGGGYGQQNQYDSERREEKKGHGNAAAWGVGGAALGLGAGALLMHEGEDISAPPLSPTLQL
jgi:hypothetical protein